MIGKKYKSKQELEIESTCESGFETYLAQRHFEFVKHGFESAVFGGLIGFALTAGVSKIDPSESLKLSHAWIPASIAILSSLIVTAKDYHRYDEEHKKDFDTVCDSIQ